MVTHGNFTLLLTTTGLEWQFQNSRMAQELTTSGQEWQFPIATDIYGLKSCGHTWHFHIATDTTIQEWQFQASRI